MDAALVILLVAAHYHWVRRWLNRFASRVAPRFATARPLAVGDVLQVVRLITAGLAQALLVVFLLWITSVDLIGLFTNHFEVRLVFLGILLGIGEMAAASLLCLIGLKIVDSFAPSDELAGRGDWITLVNSGWMAEFVKTRQLASFPVMVLIAAFYIAVEEIIFRGVLIQSLVQINSVFAFLASLFLFVLAQIGPMPSWRAALFPIIGATMVGVVHGLLFLNLPNLVPLITAHVVMFVLPMARRG